MGESTGRTGRLILFRESLKYEEVDPFIILNDDRTVYIEALKEFRESGTVSQLTELLQKEAEIYYKKCEYFM